MGCAGVYLSSIDVCMCIKQHLELFLSHTHKHARMHVTKQERAEDDDGGDSVAVLMVRSCH